MRTAHRLSGAVVKLGLLVLCLLFGFTPPVTAADGPTGQKKPTAPAPPSGPNGPGGLDSSLTLNVVDTAGNPIRGYRWILEEDTTHYIIPDVIETDPLATQFHRSYAPVTAKGSQRNTLSEIPINSGKRYFVSVLPDDGYNLSGAPVLPGQTEVTVVLNALPFKTAQISVYIFEDTHPVNNAPDIPQEAGLEGFSIFLEDAGGRYGASAGAQVTDAFGNPIGTTYKRDINGNFNLDADGVPIIDVQGLGFLLSDAMGLANFKNLAPGKYGVFVVPPANMGWQQTTTIEGTKLIDAWVKASEPPFFSEIGPASTHIFMGFVSPMNRIPAGGATPITGQVVNLHLGAPPDFGFFEGGPFLYTTPWVAINDMALGQGQAIYIAETVENPSGEPGAFTIPPLPPGNYQLVIFDRNIDLIIDFQTLTVDPGGTTCNNGGSCDIGNVPVFAWFTALDNYVFYDEDEDGFPDPGEVGIPEQNVNIRWRDGTVYQAAPTDLEGYVPFDTVFPFFNWQVAEVDFARFKATGATIVVDAGGAITPGGVNVDGLDWTFDGQLQPQLQPENGNKPYRIEKGVVLTEAFQSMIGQRNVILWGKKEYGPGDNGGISGVVSYAVTRAEDDPAYAAVEPWEPGIPGVTVRLWDKTGRVLLNETTTDDWDASLPTDCVPFPTFTLEVDGTDYAKDCFDGLANYNQVRPGIFDGGYAFDAICSSGLAATPGLNVSAGCDPLAPDFVSPIPSDTYIVEVIPPDNYEIASWEDRNVDFGLTVTPVPLLPPNCVGPERLVPDSFSLFPLFDENGNLESPTHAGEMMPLCTHKEIVLVDGFNAAADFPLFTEVPVSGHVKGIINDDTANQFGTNTPNIGEKFSPPWLPVSFRDFKGREIVRTYGDQFGNYNALVPSTFTTNLPAPSGMSPNMLINCINDPVLPDGTTDPAYDPNYGTLCYTWQFMPGVTTYLDTPVIPIAAMAGFPSNPVDCEYPTQTPMILSAIVSNNIGVNGPYADAANQILTLNAMSAITAVPNPNYCPGLPLAFDCPLPLDPNPVTLRDYTFGGAGALSAVTFVNLATGASTPGIPGTWLANSVTVTIPALADGRYEVLVTRDNGATSSTTPTGVTLHLDTATALNVIEVPAPAGFPATPIQDTIDAAPADSLLILPPGFYDEMVIMHKPLKLQGAGAGGTVINAVNAPFDKLVNWRAKVTELVDHDSIDLLPGQQLLFTEAAGTLSGEEGAGIFVASRQSGVGSFATSADGALIDGLSVTGSNVGGGIIVNGFTPDVTVSNVRLTGNGGQQGGGVRFGHFNLVDGIAHTDANNDNATVRYSQIIRNGGQNGAGAGISIYTGADNYSVDNNSVCGNFTLGNGGGIGHFGLSDGGTISNNEITFNQNFNQGATVSGGGIFVSGKGPAGATLTDGSGSVTISKNTVIGNLAGSGDGGGLRLAQINGDDVEENLLTPANWHTIDVVNNIFANNISGLAGGGVSMQDAFQVRMLHNTIAHNDSTATAADAFSPGLPNISTAQPAGIASRAHSVDLELLRSTEAALAGVADFSDPVDFRNNILYQNRSFNFDARSPAEAGHPAGPHLDPVVTGTGSGLADFWDLAVLGTPTIECLGDTSPASFDFNAFTSLTNTTTDPAVGPLTCDYGLSNVAGDPDFVQGLFNGDRRDSVATPLTPALMDVPPAFDEGGNFIQVVFGPLTLHTTPPRDYHLDPTAPVGAGDGAGTNLSIVPPFGAAPPLLPYDDIDGALRLPLAPIDIGADEF